MLAPQKRRLRFPRSLRLTKKKEISQVFAQGQVFRAGFLKFKWTALEAGRARTVISISKRVGSSPQRNRLKRLIRENLRQSPEWLDRPINLAIYVTGAPQTAPTLKEVACHLERFFRHLS